MNALPTISPSSGSVRQTELLADIKPATTDIGYDTLSGPYLFPRYKSTTSIIVNGPDSRQERINWLLIEQSKRELTAEEKQMIEDYIVFQSRNPSKTVSKPDLSLKVSGKAPRFNFAMLALITLGVFFLFKGYRNA